MTEREAIQHKLHFLALLAEKVRAEMDDDMSKPIQKMSFDDLSPDDALRQPIEVIQNFCQSCGGDTIPGSKFCPNCGAPSKKLASAQPTQAARPGYDTQDNAGKFSARLNAADTTVEVYPDHSIVILTPLAVSFTVQRLGADQMGAYEIKIAPVNAAPTSLIGK